LKSPVGGDTKHKRSLPKYSGTGPYGALNYNTSSQPPSAAAGPRVIIVASAITDSEALNAPTIKSFFASFFPADIHGKIPQIKKNKSAGLFCVD
jgi:hypothetical protein